MVTAELPGGLSFSCSRCSLGDVPLDLAGFRVDPETADSVELAVTINYDGDCDALFRVAGVDVGVSHVQFKGEVSLLLRPLINRLPIVGAVQVYFCNPPSINMDFHGIADVLDWPLVSKVFRKVLHSQIRQQLVLPKRLTVLLDTDVMSKEALFFKSYDPPEGVLRVTVVEAKGMKNLDTASGVMKFFRSGTSDPYAVVCLGHTSFTTDTVRDTVDPVWKTSTADFIVCDPFQTLTIDFYDDDVGRDDWMGRTECSAADLIKDHDKWLPISEGGGECHLQCVWLPRKQACHTQCT